MNWNPTIRGYKLLGPNYFTLALGILVFAALVYWAGASLNEQQVNGCRGRWDQSNWQSRYEPKVGCMVRTDDGRWLTEENFRAWLAGRKT